MLAHTLGNPFDVAAVRAFCEKHDLYLIEDCCDALGATYGDQWVGNFGALATLSFYPAHQITMGEGGCVLTNQSPLKKLVASFRDWGRDCWCEPGKDNTCNKRFDWQLGNLPHGFDHKYTYSHIGYNLKLTDMQAAVGVAQLQKLDAFVAARRRNFQALYEGLQDLDAFFVLPQATPNSHPSWFGFPLSVREDAPFSRQQIIQALESHQIGTRLLFGGNLIDQPAYRDVHYRVAGDLSQSDFILHQTFWIGVYPGLQQAHLDYVMDVFHRIVDQLKTHRAPVKEQRT
jgi:CDP-6-deoxy-D-xylo-4-hexulose-3-dehydrase